uniref:Uncharacterized protein n=1 Tax=Glycine max TaxID=3847 RepID=K7MJD1_SOYBN
MLIHFKSCTKVALDFTFPENIHECLRLTNEFRQLPKKHKAREDKLENFLKLLSKINEKRNKCGTISECEI